MLSVRKIYSENERVLVIFRIYEEKYVIDLKNSSLITAEVEIEFLEETTVFEIDKTFIELEVNKMYLM